MGTVGLTTSMSTKRDQGGSMFIGRLVEAIKEKLIRRDVLGFFIFLFFLFSVEMAFVVRQGMISLLGRCRGWKVSRQGVISPRYMQPACSTRAGPNVLFCFLQS